MTLRLAFMGTPAFSVPVLARLVGQGHEIAAVYSQPPRPKGRGLETESSPVAKFAQSQGLEIRTPQILKSAEPQAEFAALNLDAAVVVAYGLLLPESRCWMRRDWDVSTCMRRCCRAGVAPRPFIVPSWRGTRKRA